MTYQNNPQQSRQSSSYQQQRQGSARFLDAYRTVNDRLKEFRQEHPDWQIVTEIVEFNELRAVFRATIFDDQGRAISTGTKCVTSDVPVYLERAETGAVGRALMFLGYETKEDDEQ